ncbi:tripartite ATP-independent transporter DctM subunit [Tepidamorphus gemmatus]|uniref:TRAP transporter large permease protein n=1 Tax=Tepidamorphus gemmatus TaxID=747076 RepID=A0A4R3MHM3_9HYPH|nr:TRAP transporter large permease [Tepidamorphus gemmatus]TCT12708.1 tripartite ATP-independent transporter DctM subunit [Tepidamorphus gemmatus]
MDRLEIALLSFPVLLGMIFLRVPIGLAMLICGIVGTGLVAGWVPILASLKSLTYDVLSNHSLSIIPMFLLMGQFATKGGISRALFRAAAAFLGHRKGGVAMAAVGACAGFGAICGSSLATAATMAQVALPEMRRYGYSGALATGTLAAGGTLGILIPPSIVLVIYAILAEQNIVKMFIAAFVPGLLAAIGFMLVIAIYVRTVPTAATAGERVPARERLRALVEICPVALIFALVIGGIYVGWFTPTEAAAIGAAGTGLLAMRSGGLDWKGLADALLATAVSTAMIYFIVFGAQVFNTFLAFTQLPQFTADWVAASGLSPWLVLTLILFAYLVFGCVMDSLSMILLTVPIFFPLIMTLDFGMSPEETAIWFGILVLIVVELGLVTPPVGMNIFIINSMARDVPMTATYRGVLPFLGAELVRVALLTAVPWIVLFLPRAMG